MDFFPYAVTSNSTLNNLFLKAYKYIMVPANYNAITSVSEVSSYIDKIFDQKLIVYKNTETLDNKEKFYKFLEESLDLNITTLTTNYNINNDTNITENEYINTFMNTEENKTVLGILSLVLSEVSMYPWSYYSKVGTVLLSTYTNVFPPNSDNKHIQYFNSMEEPSWTVFSDFIRIAGRYIWKEDTNANPDVSEIEDFLSIFDISYTNNMMNDTYEDEGVLNILENALDISNKEIIGFIIGWNWFYMYIWWQGLTAIATAYGKSLNSTDNVEFVFDKWKEMILDEKKLITVFKNNSELQNYVYVGGFLHNYVFKRFGKIYKLYKKYFDENVEAEIFDRYQIDQLYQEGSDFNDIYMVLSSFRSDINNFVDYFRTLRTSTNVFLTEKLGGLTIDDYADFVHEHPEYMTAQDIAQNALYLVETDSEGNIKKIYTNTDFASKNHTHTEFYTKSDTVADTEYLIETKQVEQNGQLVDIYVPHSMSELALATHTHPYLPKGQAASGTYGLIIGDKIYRAEDFALSDHSHPELLRKDQPAKASLRLNGVPTDKFAFSNHNHDDLYYTKTEALNNFYAKNTTINNSNYIAENAEGMKGDFYINDTYQKAEKVKFLFGTAALAAGGINEIKVPNPLFCIVSLATSSISTTYPSYMVDKFNNKIVLMEVSGVSPVVVNYLVGYIPEEEV